MTTAKVPAADTGQCDKNRYFVGQNSVIYTLFPSGASNFPGDFKVEGSNILELGARDDVGDSREIIEEYTLWDSLVELAKAIEEN